MLNPRFSALAAICLISALSRLLPHPPNFTPIGALALFGGAYFSSRWAAYLVPLVSMYLSDLALGYYYHSAMPAVYISFILTVVMGQFMLRERTKIWNVAATSVLSACMFFAISNFSVWFTGKTYPKTIEGLTACYVAAIPFFGNTLAGNLFFSAILFGGFALLQKNVPALRPLPAEERRLAGN